MNWDTRMNINMPSEFNGCTSNEGCKERSFPQKGAGSSTKEGDRDGDLR